MGNSQNSKLHGSLQKTANGHASYEIYNASPEIILKIADLISARFGFTLLDLPGIGLDVVITRSRKGEIELTLGWDIWSGFYLMGSSLEGDLKVKEIGGYLDSVIGGEEFTRYKKAY